MKPVIQGVREAILSAGGRIEECIKWQAPTCQNQWNSVDRP
ncbi:MAG: hypothetical protein ACPGQL_02755 [Thermoplasmatota archaeon]